MIRKLAHATVCAWCGWWTANTGRYTKDGRAVCITCIREETQD